MSSAEATVKLSLIDRITGPINRIQKRLDRMFAPMRKMADSLGRLSRASGINRLVGEMGRLGGAVGRVGREAATLAGSLMRAAGVSFLGVAAGLHSILRTGADFERYGAILESQLGSPEAAKVAMAWVKDFATTTPLQLDQVMDGFIKLRAFGIDPMQGAFQALVDQNAKLGGDYYKLEGIILAVGQAWSKGKLQGEEALQLIERGVPVWDLLSKATGKTAAQLQELSSKGKLGRKEIRMLVTEMQKGSSGSAIRQMSTWDGIISNLDDTFEGFKKRIADAGIFEHVKSRLTELLATFDRLAASGELDVWAKNISDSLVSLANVFEDTLRGVDWAAAWTGLKDGAIIIKDISTSFVAFSDIVGGPVQAALLALGAITFGPLIAAVAALIPVIYSLGVALLTTPVGWILGAIAAIAGAAYLIYDNWGAIAQFFGDLWDSAVGYLTDAAIFIAGLAWRFYDAGAALVQRLVEGVKSSGSAMLEYLSTKLQELIDYVTGAATYFYAAGASIVSAIWDGLKAKWGDVVAWLRGAVTDLLSWLPDSITARLGFDASAAPAAVAAPGPVGPSLAPIKLPSVNTAPGSSSSGGGGNVQTNSVQAGTVTATTMIVPEPFLVHQPQAIDASTHVGSIVVQGGSGTPGEIGAAVDAALAKHSGRSAAAAQSSLSD